jgi:prepilin-type N-terminal cleavage/methylation domain-containing protein
MRAQRTIYGRSTSDGRGNCSPAFTLVEIMIVVAIIGLLVVLVIPSILKARKQSQGRRILNDVRQMNAAVDQWALDTSKKDGNPIDTTQTASYLGGTWRSTDLLGNRYRVGTVGSNEVTISRRTKNTLAGVGIDWGSF